MKGSSFLKIPILVSCVLSAVTVEAQNSLVVIPMLETRVEYTGAIKTGDSLCSVFKEPPGNWQEQDCASLPAGLEGQDGELQFGAVASPRYTDSLDGTIKDNLSGLIWLQNAYCDDVAAGHSWSEALSIIAELNAAGTMNGNHCGDTSNAGGHQNDWRLPNVRELQTLLDYGRPEGPFIAEDHPFQGAMLNMAYWSSTNYGYVWDGDLGVNLVDDAMRVNFKDAVTDGTGKNGAQHVWAVRGGH